MDEDQEVVETEGGPDQDTSPEGSDDSEESLDTDDTSIGGSADEGGGPDTSSLGGDPGDDGASLYAGKYGSVEDLEIGYTESQRLIGENSEYVRLGRMAAQHPGEFQQWIEERTRAATGQQPEPDPIMAWDPPHQMDQQLHEDMVLVANGLGDQLPAARLARVQEYTGYSQQRWNDWYTNPYRFAEEIAAPVVMQHVEQRMKELENRMWASAFHQKHRDVFDGHGPEVMAEVNSGVPPEKAVELVMLRNQANAAGRASAKKNGTERAREKRAQARGKDARKHVTGRNSRSESFTPEDLEKLADLPPVERAKKLAELYNVSLD